MDLHLLPTTPMADGFLLIFLLLLLLRPPFSFADIAVVKKAGDVTNLYKTYNNSVLLDDEQVIFFWTLSPGSISAAAQSKKRSGYLAIAFGSGMIHSYAYVGWIDDEGKGRVTTYWIDGKNPSSVHPTDENLTEVRCRSDNGFISFEFSRPISPSCNEKQDCQKNFIDPATPLKVVWARGARWSDAGHLSWRNVHARASDRAVHVLLMEGSLEPVKDVPPAMVAHGLLMFLSWGIFFPGGIMASRYLKQTTEIWFRVHVNLQFVGFGIASVGVLVAAVELRGVYISSWHAGFGILGTTMASAQLLNAYFRPKGNPKMEPLYSTRRTVWMHIHFFTGRIAILVGIVAILSGLKYVADTYDIESVDVLTWVFMLWVMACVFMFLYLEFRKLKRTRWHRNFFGDNEEDDTVNLLQENGAVAQHCSHQPGNAQVELETLNRQSF